MEDRTKFRGFGSMSKERLREIAAKGGAAQPKTKRTYFKDREHAANCGRKGGAAQPKEKRIYSRDPELASESGRRGRRNDKEKKLQAEETEQ